MTEQIIELDAQEFLTWFKNHAPWRLVGMTGEEMVISMLEEAGFTCIKQKPYFTQVAKGLIDVGSKVDIQAMSARGAVYILEVKSTSRGWKPRLSKAQANLQAFCALHEIPYFIIQVSIEENRVTIENLKGVI